MLQGLQEQLTALRTSQDTIGNGLNAMLQNHVQQQQPRPQVPASALPKQQQAAGSGKVKLFVGVLSASGNREKRDAIRQTWGAHPRLARVVFVMANPTSPDALDAIRREAMEMQDIIFVGHVQEHYLNITYQSLEIFRAAHAYNGPITHVLKCDDDSYIHVDHMLGFLEGLPFEEPLWAGSMHDTYLPDRVKKSKWFISREEWPQDETAMHWSNGPGYVLSIDLVRLLATGGVEKCAQRPFFKLEDIAVGSWLTCLEKEQEPAIRLASSKGFNVASCAQGDLLSHYMTPTQMRCMHAQGGSCCSKGAADNSLTA